jgi:hypothetical protein
MQTPPSSPSSFLKGANPHQTYGSHLDSLCEPVDLFYSLKKIRDDSHEGTPNGTPVCSPEKKRKISDSKKPPDAPKKSLKKESGPILGLPLLTIKFRFLVFMGQGSFGDVWKVALPPPLNDPLKNYDSSDFVVKTIKKGTRGSTPKLLVEESSNLGSNGCVSGYAFTNKNGDYYAFMPIGKPLDKMDFNQMSAEFVLNIIEMTKAAIMAALIKVVYDANMCNMAFFPKGTTTVILGDNGQPIIGPRTKESTVLFCDTGNCDSPEDATRTYNAILSEEYMVSLKAQAEYRRFKCEMMERLIMNQTILIPLDDYTIVRELCKEYGYTYAAGDYEQQQ